MMKKLLLLLVAFLFVSNVYGQKDYIPPKAFTYKETIKKELDTYFPELYNYNYAPALAEQESCISLTHRRCWDPASQLKTSRETGIGIFQVTAAYNADGSVRFDSLKEMRDKYKKELSDAKWETIHQRPDVQIRMMVLMVRDIYKKLYNIDSPVTRMHMVDSSYNGGLGGLLKERRACGLSSNCNPQVWFGNVEKYCLKSKKPLYGTRSVCFISREHTASVFNVRLPKYNLHYFKENM